MHEVTSPQVFDGLRAHGRPVRQPGKTFATMDHNALYPDQNTLMPAVKWRVSRRRGTDQKLQRIWRRTV
ncbi:hypothetical protein ACLK1T_07330 [Escherichia coli]